MTIDRKTPGLASRLGRLRQWLAVRLHPTASIAAAEAQANEAERRLREALDVLPEGIVFLDREGRYVLWNKRYAEIYHRSADLFREGVRLADTLRIGVERGDYPEAIGREQAWLADRLSLLQKPGRRHEQRLADGRWVLIEERKTADGGVIGLRVDISEMKAQSARLESALSQAHAANRAKSDFLANMSHEIRTPLNGVIGLADVLSRTQMDDSQRDLLRTIIASASDLNVLLGDMLDFSKLEAGKLEITPTSIAIDQLVRDCAALFGGNAAEKGLALTVEIAPEAGGEVMGDPTRIKQVLANLLSNAVKFTSQGGVALTLSLDETGARRFEVRDTGVGFDDSEVERLFGRFEQADGSTTRRFGGTGLGLAICRQLAELMDGQITASGHPGEGAVFTLTLPLPPAEQPAQAEFTGSETPPLRVLVADDNATNRKVIELMLTAAGCRVDSAENGALALEAVHRTRFDVVLMDMRMPVMDGIEATRAIRDLPRSPPVIMVSANISPSDHQASAMAGCCAHIGKPIRAEELIPAIMAALDDEPLEQVA